MTPIVAYFKDGRLLEERDEAKKWVVYVDGSSTQCVRGIGVILKSLERDKLKYAARL